MPKAFILGGSGQIGRAVAARFLSSGWDVTIAHRGARPAPQDLIDRSLKISFLDREAPGELARSLGAGADLLIDAIAYGPEHARQLLAVQSAVGAILAISSSSVYRDASGRTLDEAAATGFPELPEPVAEDQAIVEPGPQTYSTRKVALERMLLEGIVGPLTILRPAAISGPGSSHAREWWFVKRILDGRPLIPLAYRGRSRFHTTSVTNIAALCLTCAALSGKRVLNVADPAASTVSEIAKTIADHLHYAGEIVELPDVEVYPAPLGRTPWSVQRPFVLATAAAEALGYRAQAQYPQTAAAVCDWLVETKADGDWRERFPALAAYPYDLFDYAAEDEALPV